MKMVRVALDRAALEFLKNAVTAEDALNYSEPPPWYPPVRPMLGRVLLEAKQLPEAENIFRADLERNARYSRSLAGLRDCLKAQNRIYEANQVDKQLRKNAKKDYCCFQFEFGNSRTLIASAAGLWLHDASRRVLGPRFADLERRA